MATGCHQAYKGGLKFGVGDIVSRDMPIDVMNTDQGQVGAKAKAFAADSPTQGPTSPGPWVTVIRPPPEGRLGFCQCLINIIGQLSKWFQRRPQEPLRRLLMQVYLGIDLIG